jgi:hypothetical protein
MALSFGIRFVCSNNSVDWVDARPCTPYARARREG